MRSRVWCRRPANHEKLRTMTTAPDRPPPRARTRVLIVEDDASARTGLIELVRAWGYDTTGAVDGEDALRQVTADQPDVVLADLVMPGRDGLSLLRSLGDRLEEMTFVMITAQGTVDSAVSAMKDGAYDYLTKPIDPQRLRVLLERMEERHDTRRQMAAMRRQLATDGRFGRMIGSSPAVQEVYDVVQRAAPSEASVLIWGESGTVNLISYGEKSPIAPNDTRDGRAKNRRVVVRVLAADSTTEGTTVAAADNAP